MSAMPAGWAWTDKASEPARDWYAGIGKVELGVRLAIHYRDRRPTLQNLRRAFPDVSRATIFRWHAILKRVGR